MQFFSQMSNIVFTKSENLALNQHFTLLASKMNHLKKITLRPSHCTGFDRSPVSVSTSFAGAFKGSISGEIVRS